MDENENPMVENENQTAHRFLQGDLDVKMNKFGSFWDHWLDLLGLRDMFASLSCRHAVKTHPRRTKVPSWTFQKIIYIPLGKKKVNTQFILFILFCVCVEKKVEPQVTIKNENFVTRCSRKNLVWFDFFSFVASVSQG